MVGDTDNYTSAEMRDLLQSLGLKKFRFHRSFDHFDFGKGSRVILVIGAMGAGKTEFAARVIRDAEVARKKSEKIATHTTTEFGADRRNVFIVRNRFDRARFAENPADSLSYRGGYIRCEDNIAEITDSFGLEKIIDEHPRHGTWIIDEASFYDQRIAFVIQRYVTEKHLLFICPTLSLNFRRTLFNDTARLLLDYTTDIFPLTAYCEHHACLQNATYSYRYYISNGNNRAEMPALYFDPLIAPGGDKVREGAEVPNYSARCNAHHYLPGREYTFMTLKPLAMQAAAGEVRGFEQEIKALHDNPRASLLAGDLPARSKSDEERELAGNALMIGQLAERALIYLYAEENLLDESYVVNIVNTLGLDKKYMSLALSYNHRAVQF